MLRGDLKKERDSCDVFGGMKWVMFCTNSLPWVELCLLIVHWEYDKVSLSLSLCIYIYHIIIYASIHI